MKKLIITLITLASFLCTSSLLVGATAWEMYDENDEVPPSFGRIVNITWQRYKDIHELIFGIKGKEQYTKADAIIVGNIIAQDEVFYYHGENSPYPYTDSHIKVTEVISGDIKIGDIVIVSQIGQLNPQPDKNGTITSVTSPSLLEVGENYLLFLMGPHYDKEHRNGMYGFGNPAQCQYRIDSNGNLIPSDGYDPIQIHSLAWLKQLVSRAKTSPTPGENTSYTHPVQTTATSTESGGSNSGVPRGGVTFAFMPMLLTGALALMFGKRRK